MNRLPLAQVTLCAVDCQTPALAASALLLARQHIGFGRVLLLTSGWLPTVVLPGLELVEIEPLQGPAEVAHFVVRRLHAYVATSHALLMSWDSGVLHPEAWSDEFLVHDYLAAPAAPQPGPPLPGLSLRSRRYLRAGADPRLKDPLLDDALMAGPRRAFLEDAHGMSFAPPALGERFVARDGADEPWQFGFSGAGYLPAQLDESEMLEVVRRLPPEFMGSPDFAALELALRERTMNDAVAALLQGREQALARIAAVRAARG